MGWSVRAPARVGIATPFRVRVEEAKALAIRQRRFKFERHAVAEKRARLYLNIGAGGSLSQFLSQLFHKGPVQGGGSHQGVTDLSLIKESFAVLGASNDV